MDIQVKKVIKHILCISFIVFTLISIFMQIFSSSIKLPYYALLQFQAFLIGVIADGVNLIAYFFVLALIIEIISILLFLILSCYKKSRWIIVVNIFLIVDMLFALIFSFTEPEIVFSLLFDVCLLIIANSAAHIQRKDEPITWKKQAWNGKIDKRQSQSGDGSLIED